MWSADLNIVQKKQNIVIVKNGKILYDKIISKQPGGRDMQKVRTADTGGKRRI